MTEICVVDNGSYKAFAKTVPVPGQEMVELSFYSILDTAKNPTEIQNRTKMYLTKDALQRLSKLIDEAL